MADMRCSASNLTIKSTLIGTTANGLFSELILPDVQCIDRLAGHTDMWAVCDDVLLTGWRKLRILLIFQLKMQAN